MTELVEGDTIVADPDDMPYVPSADRITRDDPQGTTVRIDTESSCEVCGAKGDAHAAEQLAGFLEQAARLLRKHGNIELTVRAKPRSSQQR